MGEGAYAVGQSAGLLDDQIELGVCEATSGNWVNEYRRDHAGEEAPLSVSDRARLREIERQLREVRMENEFLRDGRLVLRPGSPVSEKYEFIETMLISFAKYIYPVSLMCLWLSISRSGSTTGAPARRRRPPPAAASCGF